MRWLFARVFFYPSLLWNLLLCRLVPNRRWWDQVDDHILIGALPFEKDARKLYEMGVRGVVNTCEEYAGPERVYDELGMRTLRIPTIDFTPPCLADLHKAVAFMGDHVQNGHRVYVHCKAGRGRSATVVICWLIARQNLEPEQAQQRLQEIRPHVNKRIFNREVVRAFARESGKADS